eukprot:TRINITY_DN471_c0_g1_i1.p2 TRINITY_DN471_c0_g1~~TRINITY_DN471_c0_g1_i1.p2  ORF type:complete len:62 (-),score=6.16 TRINITY_DN471_c0_g1_i1:26-211(-)
MRLLRVRKRFKELLFVRVQSEVISAGREQENKNNTHWGLLNGNETNYSGSSSRTNEIMSRD